MAHKNFLDKNRRYLNLREGEVEQILPEHYGELYPKFITLLEKYYSFVDEQSSTELLNHLFASRDINETDITLLSYIEDELLLGDAYFEGFGATEAEKRAAANFSNTLFRSKGSKFAIEWFFRSFYGVDAEVVYPKENIFALNNDDSRLGPESLRYITDDKLYQTFALLVRTSIPISRWNDIFKLFSHPAGMYLGSEVLISGDATSIVGSANADSAAEQYTSLAYSITADTNQDSEGTAFGFTATRTSGGSALENYDALYYYIENLSTNNLDFLGNVPDSDNPQYFGVQPSGVDAIGTFSVTARLDSDETEGQESFKVYVQDRNGVQQGVQTILVDDAKAVYTVTVDDATINEGDTVNFTITGDPTNVPNQTLTWYVNPTGGNPITAADFTTTPPLIGSQQTIQIVNDSARMSLTTEVDNNIEGDKTFNVAVALGAINKGTSPQVTVSDTTPSLSVSVPNVTEGEPFVVTVTADAFDIGETLDWNISGALASDVRVPVTSGQITQTGTVTTFEIPTVYNDEYSIQIGGTLTVTNNNYTNPVSNFASPQLLNSSPNYILKQSPEAPGTEGQVRRFQVTGTNLPNSNTYFYIGNLQTDGADFIGEPTIGSPATIAVSGNSGFSNFVTFAVNGDTEDEAFFGRLYNDAGLSVLLDSANFQIIGAPPTLTATPTSGDEGTTHTFELSGADDGAYWYWLEGTNITAGDFSAGYAPQSAKANFSVSGGTGSFDVTTSLDNTFEGQETFTAKVSKNSNPSDPLFANTNVVVNDTSFPGYTVSAPNITEGDLLSVTATSTGLVGTEVAYIEITGAAATEFATVQKTEIFTNEQTKVITFQSDAASNVFAGTFAGEVKIARNDYSTGTGTVVGSDTFSLADEAPTATLASTDTTPDEGDTITLSASGTNLPNGTYYVKETSAVTKENAQTVSSGTTVYIDDLTGLTTGMSCDNVLIGGTISALNSTLGYVTMSTPISGTVNAGEALNFLPSALVEDITSGVTGTMTISSNTSSVNHNVTFAVNSDTANDSLTFGLYTDALCTDLLDTIAITVVDATPSNSVSMPATQSSNRLGISPITAAIRLETDGDILYALLGNTPNVDGGDWVNNKTGLVSSDYEFFATVVDFPGDGFLFGTFDTWTTISSNVTHSLSYGGEPGSSVNSTCLYDLTVREIANPSNTDTMRCTLSCTVDLS